MSNGLAQGGLNPAPRFSPVALEQPRCRQKVQDVGSNVMSQMEAMRETPPIAVPTRVPDANPQNANGR